MNIRGAARVRTKMEARFRLKSNIIGRKPKKTRREHDETPF